MSFDITKKAVLVWTSSLLQVKFDVLGNLVIRLNVFDGLDVEALKSVWREVESDELGQIKQALLEVCNRVAGDQRHLFIVPNAQVHLLESGLVRLEEAGLDVFLLLFFKNVD